VDEGELALRNPGILLGYHNLPDETAKRLRDGWYYTGDVFRRDRDGFYYFVGRTDDMFVSGGENIFPGEVEGLLESHPQIAQACVVPVPDDIKGEKPFAFVVVRPGRRLTEDDVKQYALAKAPAYQHPRRVVFVDELPMAGTNKIDRAALRVRALELWGGAETAR
jgi:acyl-CoA synthetase (AMP-forming)/AMP-acid ligase II